MTPRTSRTRHERPDLPDVHLVHALVLPVAPAAVFLGPRRATLTAGLAVVALVAAGAERMTPTTENVLVQLSSLVLLSVVRVLVSRVLERRRHEPAGLRRMSEAVLRPLPRQAGPVSIASAYRAADIGTPVGGDLYAVARTDGGHTPTTFGFAPGDRLLMYTDGVTEARDGRGEFYPLLERAAAWTDHRPVSLVQAVTADLRAHAPAGLNDDMAVVALQRDEPRDCDEPRDPAVSR